MREKENATPPGTQLLTSESAVCACSCLLCELCDQSVEISCWCYQENAPNTFAKKKKHKHGVFD